MNSDYDLIIADCAARYNVPFAWIKAVISAESDFNPYAVRKEPAISDKSMGLMQLLVGTARGLGYTGPEDGLLIPSVNIELGTQLLAQLRGQYGDDFRRVYSAYNSGKPDLWQTSTEVALHVTRALDRLAQVEAEGTFLEGGIMEAGAGPGAVALLLALAVYWIKKGKK